MNKNTKRKQTDLIPITKPLAISDQFELEQDQKRKAVLQEFLEAPVSIDEIDSLKKLISSNEISIAGGDLVSHVHHFEKLLKKEGKPNNSYYHDIIFALIQIRLPEKKAKEDWKDILKHKYTMSEKLERNVGIHVAILDYYTNIKKYINNPKIVEAEEYVDTASHAISDELTKAYNRRFFDGELERLFKFADAFNGCFSLIMLDLDYFKKYNDTNGHIKGDIALMESVRIFHAICATNAYVCRYGGEEFTILIPDCSLKKAIQLAEQIRKALFDYRFINEQTLPDNRLTVSCGVAQFNEEYRHAKDILNDADRALYMAKNKGRNRVEYIEPKE